MCHPLEVEKMDISLIRVTRLGKGNDPQGWRWTYAASILTHIEAARNISKQIANHINTLGTYWHHFAHTTK